MISNLPSASTLVSNRLASDRNRRDPALVFCCAIHLSPSIFHHLAVAASTCGINNMSLTWLICEQGLLCLSKSRCFGRPPLMLSAGQADKEGSVSSCNLQLLFQPVKQSQSSRRRRQQLAPSWLPIGRSQSGHKSQLPGLQKLEACSRSLFQRAVYD